MDIEGVVKQLLKLPYFQINQFNSNAICLYTLALLFSTGSAFIYIVCPITNLKRFLCYIRYGYDKDTYKTGCRQRKVQTE